MSAASQPPRQAGRDPFADRVRQLEPVLRSYLVRRSGLPPDALADIVQETFLRLLRYRDVEAIDELRWIMLRVAASVLVDVHRRQRARGVELPFHGGNADEGRSSEPDPERVTQSAETWTMVRSVIADLPPQCRRVFVLHRFQGMSYREIADRFGVSVRTVENQISFALTRCRVALKETGA